MSMQLELETPTGDVAVTEARRVVAAWFAALNRRDEQALRGLIHLPYIEARGPRIVVIEELDQFLPSFPPDPEDAESYTTPIALRVCQQGRNVVTFEIECERFRADRRQLGVEHGLYTVVRKHGRWGVREVSIADGNGTKPAAI